jgi:GDPmannose 4,6-dehydratase
VKRVVVVGSEGQDGSILRDQLRGTAAVIGIDRGTVRAEDATWTSSVDILDYPSISALVRSFSPDELYYLAAHHHSAEDAPEPMPALVRASLDVHVVGWTNVLEAIATLAPECRAFYASSSHVFGAPSSSVQDEETPLAPIGVYGLTKVAGMNVARIYRQRGVFAACGILFNHESARRPAGFLSQRITSAARSKSRVRLGQLDAIVDWSWADDTVRAMRAILSHDVPDDFVVATGISHTVRDFAHAAYAAVGLDSRSYVDQDESVLRKKNATLVGNSKKLRTATGWRPSVTFEEMVVKLVRR